MELLRRLLPTLRRQRLSQRRARRRRLGDDDEHRDDDHDEHGDDDYPAETTTTAPPTPTTTPRHRLGGRLLIDTLPRGASAVRCAVRERATGASASQEASAPSLGAAQGYTAARSGRYVFPVVGVSGYGDSYGAFRGDVHGKWHHGDDIFAPLGAPVVAVANGTINRVGWHKRGGWRLWVRDTAANQFYYAHLSGYAPRVFHTRHVRAGDVLSFVGNTGDAFASPPHLHFEVHPHQLLRLRYDGAVDPTTYLDGWLSNTYSRPR